MALTPTSSGYSPTLPLETEKKPKWHQQVAKWLGRGEHPPARESKSDPDVQQRGVLSRRLSRKAVTTQTFRRQQSERRERLSLIATSNGERRAVSADRKRPMSTRPTSPEPFHLRGSGQSVYGSAAHYVGSLDSIPNWSFANSQNNHQDNSQAHEQPTQRPAPPPSPPPELFDEPDPPIGDEMDEELGRELEDKWILNLSMHFKDRSPREKFFVTYAETPTLWRRVTVSINYRDAPPESLERDLQSLQFQRDKSARIYEAIRTSLPDIQFFDTVTNLRLETSADERLHVHVTEDVNEIIHYPSINAVQHLCGCKRVRVSDVHFDSHMSGFVYKVKVADKVCIKKEIPGPDSVEEFLYEINALYELMGADNVIQFEGLVVDEEYQLVKGLLISYAEKGPLIDLIYDDKGSLTWERRQRWAQEIVNGLSEIHEAGYVQGDFTLSNIVIDGQDTARIIDINRRGCPVGWEPPEIARKIESGQRISMQIGVKSDLFQLGMVLWAIAEEEDEPERQHRPLSLKCTQQPIPDWYRELTHRCLSEFPQDRLNASALLSYFRNHSGNGLRPFSDVLNNHDLLSRTPSQSRSRPSDTQYIDPLTAVDRADILAETGFSQGSPGYSDSHTYVNNPPSTLSIRPASSSSNLFDEGARPSSSLSIPFDDEASYMDLSQHSVPPNDDRFRRSHNSFNPNFNNSDVLDPQVVAISPGREQQHWEISLGNENYLINEAPEGHPPGDIENTRYFDHNSPDDRFISEMHMDHVDSGLGDMSTPIGPRRSFPDARNSRLRRIEHIDSGLADMELVGVGSNDALMPYTKRDSQTETRAPEGLNIEEEKVHDKEIMAVDEATQCQSLDTESKVTGVEFNNGISYSNDSSTVQRASKELATLATQDGAVPEGQA